jgi:hypothetical protein
MTSRRKLANEMREIERRAAQNGCVPDYEDLEDRPDFEELYFAGLESRPANAHVLRDRLRDLDDWTISERFYQVIHELTALGAAAAPAYKGGLSEFRSSTQYLRNRTWGDMDWRLNRAELAIFPPQDGDVAGLTADVANDELDMYVRCNAVVRLGMLGEAGISAVPTLLNVFERTAAELPYPGTILWDFSQIDFKREILLAVSKLNPQIATPILGIILLDIAEVPHIRGAAAASFGLIIPHTDAILNILKSALEHPNGHIRAGAVEGIRNIGNACKDFEVVDKLIRILRDEGFPDGPDARQMAVFALSGIGNIHESIIPALIEAFASASPTSDLRSDIARALGRFGAESADIAE